MLFNLCYFVLGDGRQRRTRDRKSRMVCVYINLSYSYECILVCKL